ncbi:Conserved_hypothetical protein [Hexamita inflata]|uniref:Uncharacterized protein n=1 Tax=Hexamita inflata TaxID=28002 RepID=A0AA86R179_9EUKA|nr:Conserved hypothetical protein [Hexamita inflata]
MTGQTRNYEYYSKQVITSTAKIQNEYKPIILKKSPELTYNDGIHDAFNKIHAIAAKKPGITLKERQCNNSVFHDRNSGELKTELKIKPTEYRSSIYGGYDPTIEECYYGPGGCEEYDRATFLPDEPFNKFIDRKILSYKEIVSKNSKEIIIEQCSWSGFVLKIEYEGQTLIIQKNFKFNNDKFLSKMNVTSQAQEKYDYICEIQKSSELMNNNINLNLFNMLSEQLVNWQLKSHHEKLEYLQLRFSLEVLLYIKNNDNRFFETDVRQWVQNVHCHMNIYIAYLLDDYDYIKQQIGYFNQLNPLEQFLILFSDVPVPQYFRNRFILDNNHQIDETRKQKIIQFYLNNSKFPTNDCDQKISVTQSNMQAESLVFNFKVQKDPIFVQLLNNNVQFPYTQQTDNSVKQIILSFIKQDFRITKRLKKQIQNSLIRTTYTFTDLIQNKTVTEPLANTCYRVKAVITNKSKQLIQNESVFFSVVGAEVIQEFNYNVKLEPEAEQEVLIFILLITGDFTINSNQETHIQVKLNQKQIDSNKLIAQIKNKTFTPELICRNKTIDDKTVAQIIKTFAPKQASTIIQAQYDNGQRINKYLLSFPQKHNQLNKKLIKALILQNNTFLNNRILPIKEIHPLIMSRTLQKQGQQQKFDEIYTQQLFHSLIFKDYENLFYLAVIKEDFNFAQKLFPKCRFARRHQQAVHYYNACVSGGAYAYDPQFNTYSVESALKYGKAAGCNAEKTSIQVKNQKLAIQSKHPRFQVVELKNRQDFQLVQVQKPEELEVRGELTVPIEQKKQHLVVRCELEAFALKNEAPKVHVYRLGNGMVRVTESNRPARKFVEVVVNGAVVQCGYTDVLGLFKVFHGNGEVRVCEQE